MASFTVKHAKGGGLPIMAAYTPAAAKASGDVVVVNGRPSVVHSDIAADALGGRAVFGGVYICTADGAMNAGDDVFWDASALKVTKTSNGNTYFGWLTEDSTAAADGDSVYVLHMPKMSANGKLYSQVAAATAHSNTTTEALFDKSISIAANTLRAGDILKIRAQGIATSTNSTDTLTAVLYLGGLSGIALATTGAVDVANDDIFAFDYDVVIRTAGDSGTMVGTGYVSLGASGTVTAKAVYKASTSIDTTAAQVVGVGADWSVASASNSARLDILNVHLLRS